MARAIWTGSISFGLVSIPVRLHPAISPKDVRFREVDRSTGRRVRRRRVVVDQPPPYSDDDDPDPWAQDVEEQPLPARTTEPPAAARAAPRGPSEAPPGPAERAVAPDDVVKAFEVEPGRVVEVEREEIEAARAEQTRTIEIERFVELAEIDPVFFEKSYHLAPAEELAHRPYALLRTAMERSGRVAIGRFVLRTKEHLVAVRPTQGILGLETLYFADEVNRPAPAWVAVQDRAVAEREITMSLALIEALAGEWRPEEFDDRDRTRLMELIGAKAPRELEPDEDESAADSGPGVPDLMEALRASVEAIQARKRDRGRRAGER